MLSVAGAVQVTVSLLLLPSEGGATPVIDGAFGANGPDAVVRVLLADHALFHLEADLRWIDLTSARLVDLAKAVGTR